MNLPVTREAIFKLQDALSTLPQVEIETRHYWADGVYCREMVMPEGTVVIGKVHKREHFFMVTKGRIRLAGNGETRDVEAPAVIVAQPGSKRAIIALTDSACANIHRTFETDLEAIEREFLEPDETAMFDSSNKLRPPALEKL